MAQATSGEKTVTIDGEKYKVRTQVVYQPGLGVQGTLSTTSPIRYVVQYLPESSISNPIPVWTNLGERDVSNKNNWIFTNAAGAGFQKALIANGPNTLTTSLDDATSNALSKSAGVTKQQATQILQVAPNVAPVAPAAVQPTQGGNPNIDAAINAALSKPINEKIDVGTAAGARSSYGNLYYPQALNDVRRSQQDRIVFTMFKYAPATFNTTVGAQTITREIKDSLGTVTLPIQPSITDGNSADWSGGSINPIQALAVGGALNMMGSTSPQDFFGKGIDLVQKASFAIANNQSFQKGMNIYLAQEAVGVQNLLSRTSGAILNPNLELLFNGPSLRNFAFTFRLSARDETEATQIRKIIRFFKQGMAVKKTTQNVFLKAPNVFGIDYKTVIDGTLNFHPSLNRIKKCALIACDVDYTPDGTYMTFDDGAKTITSYQLSLRFSELEPIYESDYNDIDGIAFNAQGEQMKGKYDSGGIGY